MVTRKEGVRKIFRPAQVKTKRCRKEQAGAIATYNFPEDGLPTTDCPEGYCCWHSLPSCAGKGSPEGCPWRMKEFNEVRRASRHDVPNSIWENTADLSSSH